MQYHSASAGRATDTVHEQFEPIYFVCCLLAIVAQAVFVWSPPGMELPSTVEACTFASCS